MYAVGLLSEKYNLFWEQEFTGYHGLKSVNHILKLSMNSACNEKFDRSQLDHYYSLMKYVCPVVKDEICFQLISMVMLFDTANLAEAVPTELDMEKTSIPPSLTSSEDDKTSRLCSSNITSKMPLIASSGANKHDDCSSTALQTRPPETKKMDLGKEFDEIKGLQNQYIHLLRRRCMLSEDPRLRRLGDVDGLNRTIDSFKKLAQLVSLLE